MAIAFMLPKQPRTRRQENLQQLYPVPSASVAFSGQRGERPQHCLEQRLLIAPRRMLLLP
jgi:hypothetical protein